jgi:hypothetical protein
MIRDAGFVLEAPDATPLDPSTLVIPSEAERSEADEESAVAPIMA